MAKKQSEPVTHPFDAKHGTETSGLIPGRKLKTGHAHDRYITAYHGTAPSLFEQVLKKWRASGTARPPEDYVFVDVGAGKGRVMMLASRMGFREVRGVELHPELVETARRNIALAKAKVKLVEGDILTAPLPKGPCLLYLFNPFGATVLRRMLKRMEAAFAARAGELDVIYVNDEHRKVFDKSGAFRELWAGTVYLSKEDEDSDRATIKRDAKGLYVSSGEERCSLWRFTGVDEV